MEYGDVMTTDEKVSPRARMVRSAARMICERGVHGVGMRQIAADAEGSRGSLQRYFPGGKNQILIEAIDLAFAQAVEGTRRAAVDAENLADAIAMIVAPWRSMLIDYDFAVGCPIAAFVVDASSVPPLREQANARFTMWREGIEAVYRQHGRNRELAREEAVLVMAALEGAALMARAAREVEPIDTVERLLVKRAE